MWNNSQGKYTNLNWKIVQERHECTQEQSKEFVSEEKEQKKEQKKEELTNHNFKMGDYVTHKKYGGKMKVVGIKNNRITCDRGWFSGITSYDASELEPYKE